MRTALKLTLLLVLCGFVIDGALSQLNAGTSNGNTGMGFNPYMYMFLNGFGNDWMRKMMIYSWMANTMGGGGGGGDTGGGFGNLFSNPLYWLYMRN